MDTKAKPEDWQARYLGGEWRSCGSADMANICRSRGYEVRPLYAHEQEEVVELRATLRIAKELIEHLWKFYPFDRPTDI